jgi:hypothetical protein
MEEEILSLKFYNGFGEIYKKTYYRETVLEEIINTEIMIENWIKYYVPLPENRMKYKKHLLHYETVLEGAKHAFRSLPFEEQMYILEQNVEKLNGIIKYTKKDTMDVSTIQYYLEKYNNDMKFLQDLMTDTSMNDV